MIIHQTQGNNAFMFSTKKPSGLNEKWIFHAIALLFIAVPPEFVDLLPV
jgi:hypothetical protein